MAYKKPKPKVGEKYTDAQGRTLVVTEVRPGDPLGREVVGKYKRKGDRKTYTFSTTLPMWADTWRDKRPPTNPSNMKAW